MANFLKLRDMDQTVLNVDVATKIKRMERLELWVWFGSYVEQLEYSSDLYLESDFHRINSEDM